MQKRLFLVLLLPLLLIPSVAFGINLTDSEIRIADQQKKIIDCDFVNTRVDSYEQVFEKCGDDFTKIKLKIPQPPELKGNMSDEDWDTYDKEMSMYHTTVKNLPKDIMNYFSYGTNEP